MVLIASRLCVIDPEISYTKWLKRQKTQNRGDLSSMQIVGRDFW